MQDGGFNEFNGVKSMSIGFFPHAQSCQSFETRRWSKQHYWECCSVLMEGSWSLALNGSNYQMISSLNGSPDDQITLEWNLFFRDLNCFCGVKGRQPRLDGVLWNKDKRARYKILPGNQCDCIPGHKRTQTDHLFKFKTILSTKSLAAILWLWEIISVLSQKTRSGPAWRLSIHWCNNAALVSRHLHWFQGSCTGLKAPALVWLLWLATNCYKKHNTWKWKLQPEIQTNPTVKVVEIPAGASASSSWKDVDWLKSYSIIS